MKHSRLSEFTRYTLSTSVSQGVILLCAVAAAVVTARVLGPAGKGQLAQVLLIPALATTFGRMGIGHAINFYSSKTERGRLILNSAVLGAIIGFLLIVVMTFSVYVFKGQFFNELNNQLLLIIILCIPVYLFNNITSSLIQGMYQIPLCNRLNALQAIINVVLLIIVIYWLNKGVTGAVLVNIFAMSVVVFISLIILLRMVRFSGAFLDLTLIGNLLKFGTKSHVGNILKDLSYRGDILIVSYFLPSASVGYYVVALTFSEILLKFPDAIGTVLLPKVAAMTPQSARVFTPKACRMVIIPAIIACLTIFFLGKPIVIGLFGRVYEPSVDAILFLLPGVLSLSVWKILANDLIGQGYPTLYSISSGVALVTMIVIDIVLIPVFGINGAAIGSSIAYTLATVTIVFFYKRLSSNSLIQIFIPQREDISYFYEVAKIIFLPISSKINWKRGI